MLFPEIKTLRVKSGPHVGREGKLVSIPWLSNLFNYHMTLNVPATEEEIRRDFPGCGERVVELIDEMKQGHGPRAWITVWSWNTEEIKCTTQQNPTRLVY